MTKLHNFYTDFIKILESINWLGGEIKQGKNTVSKNINSDTPHSALDFVGNRDLFFDPYDYNSSTNFPNYSADEIIDLYHEVVKKMCEPQEGLLLFYNTGDTYADFNAQKNMIDLFTRRSDEKTRIVDVLKKMVLPQVKLPLVDIYLSEFMKTPNATDPRYNFLYFIRRFPIVNYLFLDHIKKTSPKNIIKLINEHGLERSSPPSVQSLIPISNTVFNVESPADQSDDLGNTKVKEDEINTFLTHCNKVDDTSAMRYNTNLLLTGVDKIEDYVFSFPFLETENKELETLYRQVMRTLSRNTRFSKEESAETSKERIGLYGSLCQGTVIDDVDLLFSYATRDSSSFPFITFKYREDVGSDYFGKQLVTLFCIDMLQGGVSPSLTFNDKVLSQYLSSFVIKMYWIHTLLKGKNIDEIMEDIRKNIEPDSGTGICDEADKYKRNSVLFYFKASQFIFANTSFNIEVKNGIQRMSYLFFVINFFKNRSKDLFPFFVFASFSDSRIKYIKSYPTKTNAFFDWLTELYDSKFSNTSTVTV